MFLTRAETRFSTTAKKDYLVSHFFAAFTDSTDYVNKYVWRYGSTYYPQSPIELVPDSTLALETSLATLDLKNNERPFMATLEDNATESHPRFESRDFVLAHSFRKSGDKGLGFRVELG